MQQQKTAAPIRNRTPSMDGFRMPAEFEPHAGAWMLWPERHDNWRAGAVPAQRAFAAVATAISQSEPVTMCASAEQFQQARAALPAAVRVVEMSSDDAWMRDVGPTFVVDRRARVRGVHWIFNAWGGRSGGIYSPWDRDAQVAAKVLEVERCERYRAPFVLEGGAIHVDGRGTLLTTEECLLNPNRNPDLRRGQIETLLQRYLGIEQIIWLKRGVYKDETDGHVDNLCCFVRPGEVVLTWCDDPEDPQYDISHEAYETLRTSRDKRGKSLKVHKLPQPGPLYMSAEEAAGIEQEPGSKQRHGGDRLAGSYVNFYIANRFIVMPLLDARTDKRASTLISRLFPGREVIGVPSREILLGGGNIHCITQQQPRPRRVMKA
ncbi:MAG: agmatine deiminase [Steroidobacteraceae bacterium]|nr:agmatine deiminase [Steroidobacteraceae bacterium]